MTTDQLTYDVLSKYENFVEYNMESIVDDSLNRGYTVDEFAEALAELIGLMTAHMQCAKEGV